MSESRRGACQELTVEVNETGGGVWDEGHSEGRPLVLELRPNYSEELFWVEALSLLGHQITGVTPAPATLFVWH